MTHYNFCRVHETLRVTPAVQLGVTDHIWNIGKLVDVALSNQAPKPDGRKIGPFRVIEGGRQDYATAKVTGEKVFVRDIRARDMPHWPQRQAHALVLRVTPDAEDVFSSMRRGSFSPTYEDYEPAWPAPARDGDVGAQGRRISAAARKGDVAEGGTGGGARTKNLTEKIASLREKRGRYGAMLADPERLTDPDRAGRDQPGRGHGPSDTNRRTGPRHSRCRDHRYRRRSRLVQD